MSPSPSRCAAFFDVDGTLLDTNIVLFYVHYRTADMSPARRWLWMLAFLRRAPLLFVADKMNRGLFNRLFYLLYDGMDAEHTKRLAAEMFPQFPRPRLFAEAETTVRNHLQRGEQVVLVTGTADFIARPLADYLAVEHVIAVELEVRDGRFTGNLTDEPLSDEAKARAVRAFAATHDVDLDISYAYGDSTADAAMLRCVGKPVAVNPSRTLERLARRNGWRVERWRR